MSPRDYMLKVKTLPCVLCTRLGMAQTEVTEAHHLTLGRGKGTKNADWLVIALCRACHLGTHGVHGDKRFLTIAKCDELDLLADTIEAMQ